MTDELSHLIEIGKITSAAADKLLLLSPGAHCTHRSWGLGRIAEWRFSTDQIIIDFGEKKGHSMQLEYAIETLTFIPQEHILARIASDPEAIRQEAKKDPVGLIRGLLRDHHGSATAEEIAAALVPAIFDAASFKKWFEATKKKLKADGHFNIPTKKTAPIELQETKIEPERRLLEQFTAARHPKEQVATLDAMFKILQKNTLSLEELQSLAGQLEEAAERGERMHATKALELLLLRHEMAKFDSALALSSNKISAFLEKASKKLSAIFTELPPAKYRRILEVFPTAFPEEWQEHTRQLLRQAEPRLIGEIFNLFEQEKNRAAFAAIMSRLIQERSATSDLLAWLCEERSTAFPEFINSELLAAILSSLERDLVSESKKSSRLQELIFKDRELVGDLLKSADSDTARHLIRKIMMSPAFTDLDRRSLLARILKVHPDLQSVVTGHQEKEAAPVRDENLIVSWGSLERRKNEYEHLITKLIPQNTSDIAVARSYGDLRENLEFKAAKEQQSVLMRQKSELETMLRTARGTNFENPDTSVVSIGTVVTLEDPSSNEKEIYSVLGAWDGLPEKNWISYQTAIGQNLLGHSVGESITLPHEEKNRTMTIKKIEPFTETIEA